MSLYEQLVSGEESLSLVGLGYVGMPIAVAFSKKIKVIGFDLNAAKIELYKSGIDPTNEVGDEAIKACKVQFTADETALRNAKFHIVAVPTPVYDDHTPEGQHLQVYVNTAFLLDPVAGTVTDPVIIGTKGCYPPCKPKVPRLADCVFTTGILPRPDGKVDLFSGVGDAFEGRITIDDPFAGEGEIICKL